MNFIETQLFRIQYRLDKWRGYDFLAPIQPEEVGFDRNLVHPSVVSSIKYIKKVIKKLPVSENDSILDIGCGKGNAMRAFLKFPFAKIHGIEIAPKIAQIAMKNFKNISRIEIFAQNAIDFNNYDKYSFFYFYNPFPESVMKHVINKILNAKKNKKHWIIYYNPICENLILDVGNYKTVLSIKADNNNKITAYQSL